MKLLFATFDGAGNLPPILALATALIARGHEVHVIAHDSQRTDIEAAGGTFIGYQIAPQLDQREGFFRLSPTELAAIVASFHEDAPGEVLAAAARLAPAAVLIDCMAPTVLTETKAAGYKSIALVHAIYSFWLDFWGGACRGPIESADLALGLTYKAFDRAAPFPDNLAFVGPVRPELGAAPWPRRHPDRPFIVASLSTGLQSAGQPELLQRVCDALAELDVESLVTTGRGIKPEALRVGPMTSVAPRVTHDAVLPQADLLVTHAGHGTVMAAIRYGTPMLCLAPAADQPLNASKVVELGLGVSLDPAASAEAIKAGVEQVLGDPSFTARSQAFAEAVAGEPGIARAVELVEALATP